MSLKLLNINDLRFKIARIVSQVVGQKDARPEDVTLGIWHVSHSRKVERKLSGSRCEGVIFSLDLGNSQRVTTARKRGLKPESDDFDGHFGGNGAFAQRENVRIVVFARPASGLLVPT